MKERRLELWLRALWGAPFEVRFADLGRSRFSEATVLLPTSSQDGWSELDVARATHAALHSVFSALPFEPGKLRPVQRALASVLEDARVESLAISRFPGLREVWAPFYVASPSDGEAAPALLGRLARALFDSSYRDPNGWVQRAAEAFIASRLEREGGVRQLASVLGNELGQMRLPFDPAAPTLEPRYRDDHTGLWRQESQPAQPSNEATDDARREATPGGGARVEEEGGRELLLARRYPEWDYVIARERPEHCAIREQRRAPRVPVAVPSSALHRLRAALRRAHEAPRPRRRSAEGLELDLGAVVTQASNRARGDESDDRLYVGHRRRHVRTSTLVLLDLSASVEGAQLRLLQTISVALAKSWPPGAELAIDGFCSRGREDVRYERFKPFDAPSSGFAPDRSISGSTRLGTALRHATNLLAQRRAARKLLLVVSDGEPADVDVFDERYLVEDARRACAAARARGVRVVAWCLRPRLALAQRRIFGRSDVLSVQRLEELPRHALRTYSLRRSGRSGEP